MPPACWRPTAPEQRPRRLLGALATAEPLVHALLFEALLLYLFLNLNFVFWYWYFDQPLHLLVSFANSATKVQLPLGILFLEEAIEDGRFPVDNWISRSNNYIYFTVWFSNYFLLLRVICWLLKSLKPCSWSTVFR